jgi:PilZ domain
MLNRVKKMIEAATIENRANKRRRCLLGARVIFNERQSTMSCRIRNISDFGARLEFGACPALPDSIELMIDSEAGFAPARIVWRDLNHIGIAFDKSQTRNGKQGLAVSLLMDAMPIQSRRLH